MRTIGELRKKNNRKLIQTKDNKYYIKIGHYGHPVDIPCGVSYSYSDSHGVSVPVGGIDNLIEYIENRMKNQWRLGYMIKRNNYNVYQFKEIKSDNFCQEKK